MMFGSLTQYAKKKFQNTFKNIKEHSCIELVAILHDLVVTGKKATRFTHVYLRRSFNPKITLNLNLDPSTSYK